MSLKLCFLFCLMTTYVIAQTQYFESRNLYPVGFDYDATNQRFLVGSLQQNFLTAVYRNGTVVSPASDARFVGAANTYAFGVRVYSNQVLVAMSAFGSQFNISYMAVFDPSNLTTTSNYAWTNTRSMGGIAKLSSTHPYIYATDPIDNVMVAYNTSLQFTGRTLINSTLFWTGPLTDNRTLGVYGIDAWSSYFIVSNLNRGQLLKFVPDNTVSGGSVSPVNLINTTLNAPRMVRFNSYGQLAVVTAQSLYILESTDNWVSAYTKQVYPITSSYSAADVTWIGNTTYVIYTFYDDLLAQKTRTTFLIQKVPDSFAAVGTSHSFLLLSFLFMLVVALV